MKRIPEPELMNEPEQAMAYAGADFSEPHEHFVSLFNEKFPDFSEGHVLDLGCGTCDVIIRFARRYPFVTITGVDGAEAMLEIGRELLIKEGFEKRIHLQLCHLPDRTLMHKQFDAVISNSLLHHLSDPHVLWETVKSCSVPEAPVFIMDLLRPPDIKTAEYLVEKYAGSESPILKKDFYNSLLSAYNIREVKNQLLECGLYYLSIEQISDRHFIVWGRRR